MPGSWALPAKVEFTPLVEIFICVFWRNLFQTKDVLNDNKDIQKLQTNCWFTLE